MRAFRAVAVGFAVVIACGGDDGVSINTNKDNVCSQIAEVACHNLYQCCTEGEIENYLNVSDPRTEAQCRDDLTKACDRQEARIQDAITNKRVTFDSKIMNDCLESIVAPSGTCASVDMMAPWVDACMDSAWIGAVADGGMCHAGFECVTDSYCSPGETCIALPTANMPCSSNGCASGLYCNAGTCAALVAQGGMCTSTSQCAKDLFCDTTSATPTCTALHAGGEHCTSSSTCASNQCLPGTCTNSTSTCYTDANCGGRCQTGNFFCSVDRDCGNGTCSNSPTTFCSSDLTCQGLGSGSGSGSGSGTSGTCVYTNHCMPGTCQGDIVCADAQVVVDYCSQALGALPKPPTN